MNHHMYALYAKISDTSNTPIVVGTGSRHLAKLHKQISEKSRSLTHDPVDMTDRPGIAIDLLCIHAVDCSDEG